MKEVKPKIYTRGGDDGTTGLVGGKRVSKGELRLECYGTIDELNAAIGLVTSELQAAAFKGARLLSQLRQIQNELFNLGSRLACVDPQFREKLPPLQETHVTGLERWIDEMTADLPPLQNFILPGGSRSACLLHLARTVARRGERWIVRLHLEEPLEDHILRYVNRLSDYLFIAGRWCNHASQIPETPWRK